MPGPAETLECYLTEVLTEEEQPKTWALAPFLDSVGVAVHWNLLEVVTTHAVPARVTVKLAASPTALWHFLRYSEDET